MDGQASPAPPVRPGSRATVAVLVTAVFVYGVLESMLVPAMPLVQRELGASAAEIAWVLTGLLLAGAVSIPLIGRLAEVTDKRRLLLGVLVVVCVGIAVAATATTVIVLMIGQVIQGIGLGLIGLSAGLLRDTQPADRIKTSTGLVLGTAGFAGTAIGLVLAGPLVTVLPYTWLYWLPLAVLVVTTVVAWRTVPSCPPPDTAPGALRRVDWLGAGLLSVGLVALLLTLTVAPGLGWTSGIVLGAGAVVVALLAGFVVVELRRAEPLVDLRLLTNRTVGLACVVSFVVGFGTFGVNVLLPSLAAQPASTGFGIGADTMLIGLLLFPFGVLGSLTAPLAGRLERRLGARVVLAAGIALVLAAPVTLLFAPGRPWLLFVGSAVGGAGIGLMVAQSLNLLVAVVPAERMASVSSAVYVLRNVGGVLGGGIGASLLVSATDPVTAAPAWSGYASGLAVCAVVGVVALVAALGVPARPAPVASPVAS